MLRIEILYLDTTLIFLNLSSISESGSCAEGYSVGFL